MADPLGQERQITFFQRGGHNHDGENSSPVVLLPGSISLFNLDPNLASLIRGGTTSTSTGNDNVMPVPDLVFETPPIAPGASYTATVPWVGISFVRFMRILMSQDSECIITFYHDATFLDENREFRARNCANRFLWEGTWGHYDDLQAKDIYYKIENTGNVSATFQVTLKSGTMAANAYSRFVEDIQVNANVAVTGHILFQNGNGVEITEQAGVITFNAVAPETVYVRTWATSPVKPVSFSSSATISNPAGLLDGTITPITFGTGLQWVQADLGGVVNLGGVIVNQYVSDGRVFHGVKVELSADGTNFITFRTSGDVWATEEGMRVEIPTGFLARYIRVWCNGSTTDTNNYVSKIVPLTLSDKQ